MPRTGTARWIHRARELATEVLAPAAMRVESSQRVPPEQLDLLAAEGFYGWRAAWSRRPGRAVRGGLQIIEILAGACLSTTFVWMQHRSVVRAVAGTANTALRQAMLGPLCRGERACVAPALLPRQARLRAPAGRGRYVLDGDLAVGHRLGDTSTPCTSPPAARTTPSCGPCWMPGWTGSA